MVEDIPKCHLSTHPDQAREVLNKQQNMLETVFNSSLHFPSWCLCTHLFPCEPGMGFLCTQTRTRIDTMLNISVWSVESWLAALLYGYKKSFSLSLHFKTLKLIYWTLPMTGTYCKIVVSKLFSKIITTFMSLIITGYSMVVACTRLN